MKKKITTEEILDEMNILNQRVENLRSLVAKYVERQRDD